jgi:hypothetical protein
MLFLERFSIKSMTTTLKCPNWTKQPGFLVDTFGGVKIILARVFEKAGEWHVLIVSKNYNDRITINGCSYQEVFTEVRKRFNI